MKLKKVLPAIFTNLLLFITGNCQGQDALYLLDSANVCEVGGLPAYAASLYERILFFYEEDSISYFCHKRLGDIKSKEGQYADAAWHYKKASAIDDEIEAHTLMKQAAFNYLMSGDPDAAINTFDTSDLGDAQSSLYYESVMYLGLAWELKGNVDQAFYYYNKFYSKLGMAEVAELKKLDRQMLRNKCRDPQLAYVLSLLVPGAGQVYSGSFKQGLNSFLLNGSLISLMIYTSFAYTWIDGVTAFGLWIPRYYFGGADNAAILALKYNERSQLKSYGNHLKFFTKQFETNRHLFEQK